MRSARIVGSIVVSIKAAVIWVVPAADIPVPVAMENIWAAAGRAVGAINQAWQNSRDFPRLFFLGDHGLQSAWDVITVRAWICSQS